MANEDKKDFNAMLHDKKICLKYLPVFLFATSFPTAYNVPPLHDCFLSPQYSIESDSQRNLAFPG